MQAAEDLRRVILDASLDLVAAEGLAALSMREVARRAGVSHQAPYHHFKDRGAILSALAAEGYERSQAAMRKAAAKAATAPERFEAAGRSYIVWALENPALFKIMHQSELAPIEQHPQALAIAQQTFELVVGLAADAAAERGSDVDASALAVTAWATVHGAAMLLLENRLQQKFPHARNKPKAAIDSVLKTFSRLIG